MPPGDDSLRRQDDRLLGRLEESLDRLDATISKIDSRLDNHAERLRSLEQSRSWAMGAGAALGALSGWISAKLGK